MSKLIEIVVVGAVGSGKSHVLAVIDAALRVAYGPHTQVVSRELSLERGLGGPTTKPPVDIIFDLKERGPGSDSVISRLKVEVDTSDIDAALVKAEALSLTNAGLEPGQAVAGCFAIDPLESAIDQTVRLISECQGNQEVRLTNHLDRLLALQLKRVERVLE